MIRSSLAVVGHHLAFTYLLLTIVHTIRYTSPMCKPQALLLSERILFTSIYIYIPKGGQVAGLGVVDIEPSVAGRRLVPAGTLCKAL